MRKAVLISCSKLKRAYPCEARLLYDASSLFRKSLAYALTISGDIYVLSAKHGLVSRMPMVCQAMRKLMKVNDVILYQPHKRNGATFETEYKL